MSEYPKMIYQAGDQEAMHEGRYNYTIVGDDVAEAAMLADGWYLTTTEAKAANEKPADPVEADAALMDRSALEARATELGIKFDGRTTDRKLNTLIIEKLG